MIDRVLPEQSECLNCKRVFDHVEVNGEHFMKEFKKRKLHRISWQCPFCKHGLITSTPEERKAWAEKQARILAANEAAARSKGESATGLLADIA